MNTAFAIALVDEVNARLEPGPLLDIIDFQADKVQQSGSTLKAFCPIHKDSRFRSMLIDAERKAFRCTIKTCQGFAGGSLLELYALSRNLPYLMAALELVQRMELDMEQGWQEQLVESYLSDAAAAKNRSDLTEAETLLNELITVMPDMPEARIMLAGVQAEMGNPQAAAEEYARLIDHLMSKDQLEDADLLASDAVKRFPENEDLLFAKVKIAEAQGDQDAAIQQMQEIVSMREATNRQMDNIGLLEKLIKSAPDRPEIPIKLASLYEQQHNVRAASRQYENAAKLYLAAGQKAEGIELLEKVIQFNGENVRARLELAAHFSDIGQVDKARDQTFRAVNQQIDQQEFGPAVATVNSWLEREPDNIDARELLARIYLDQERGEEAAAYLIDGARIAAAGGDHSRAADLLLRAKFLTPDAAPLRRSLIEEFDATGEQQRAAFEMVDLAEILFSSSQAEEASELLYEGLAKDISTPLKLQMISSLANHGRAEQALEHLHMLVESLSDSTPADEVVDLYELLARLEPGSAEAHLRHIEALWTVSPDRGAEATAESATSLWNNSHELEAVRLLEFSTERLQQYVPAVPRLLELCEQCSRIDLAGAIYQAAIQGFADQDPEAALKAARKMAAIDQSHPSASSDIGFLLASLGKTGEAAEQYAMVANLLRNSGDYETALQFAREAAALDPESVNAIAIRALIARELLSPEETAELAADLLEIAHKSADPNAKATGYLAYSELYPEDDALLTEAADALEKLDLPEALAQIQARQASRLSASGDWLRASELLQEAASNAPGIPPVHEQLGESLLIGGKRDAAAIAYANASSAYARLGDINNATRCAESCENAKPETAPALEALFKVADATTLTTMARDAAQKLTKLFSQNGPPPSTVKWAREWVRFAADEPRAHEALGKALAAIDQIDNATSSLSAAAALFLQNSQPEKSLQALQSSAEIGKLQPEASKLLSSIIKAESPGTPVHEQASQLLCSYLVQSEELDAARNLASQLSTDGITAILWSEIAQAEQDVSRATADYTRAAQVHVSNGNSAEAIKLLQSAVALGQPTDEIHLLLAELLTQNNRRDEALPHQLHVLSNAAREKTLELDTLLTDIRAFNTENVDARIELAKVLLSAGMPELAMEDLEVAAKVATTRNDAAALVTICSLDEGLTRRSSILTSARADSLMGMENAEQALEFVSKTGRELLEAGKPDEAYEMAQRWISLASKNPAAYRLLVDTAEALHKLPEANNARVKISELLAEAGEHQRAINELEAVLLADPTFETALRVKADLQQATEDSAAAADTLVKLAELQLSAGSTREALITYRSSLALDPENTAALWGQAELVRDIDGVTAALPLYRQWANVRRENVGPSQWINDLTDLLQIVPGSVALLRELTDAMLAVGRSVEAESYLEELSNALEIEGDYQGAAEALESAIAHHAVPSPEKHLAVAELYRSANRPALAQDHLRKAGTGFSEQGKFAEAVDALESLLKVAGDAALPEDLALLGTAYAAFGDTEAASRFLDEALSKLQAQTSNRQRREKLLAQALDINPLNADYVLAHMDLLPAARAMQEGLRNSREMAAAGHAEDSIRVISAVISLAPHDMSLRQEIFEPLRQTGNQNRLRQELLSLATDAIAAGDNDAAHSALDEAGNLAMTAQQHRAVGELNERARRMEQAASNLTAAAILFADEGKTEQSIASINRAASAHPSAIPAESMADLVRRLGPPAHDIAREQLRAALTARKQKQSQVLTLALLESVPPERGYEILKTVNTLGGSTFLVGIARQRIDLLLQDDDVPGALALAEKIMSISPDSPDAWYLSAQVSRRANKLDDARRAAMEAARLYNMAGAVIEEEDCYLEALNAEPGNLAVKATLAEYYVRESREDKAVTLLLEIVGAAESTGNPDTLLDYLNRAVQVAPANTDLREKLAVALEPIAPDSAVDNWLQVAASFLEAKLYERARAVFGHVISLHPQNETALQGLLTHAMTDGDLEKAGRFTKTLAEVKASRKNIGGACRLLQSYLELDPDNLEILERLSELSGTSNDAEVFTTTTRALARKFQKLGDSESALQHYEALLVRQPRDVATLSALLDCSAATGNREKGLAYARQLLGVARETEDPERIRLAAATILNYDAEDATAHYELGQALLSLNRIPQAVSELLHAAELFEGAGNTSEAFTCYRRVTQINPSTMQAWRRLADMAITSGDFETARMGVIYLLENSSEAESKRLPPLLSRLLIALPDDEHMHHTALNFYRDNGDIDKAVSECIWLAQQAEKRGNEEQAENILSEGLKWALGNKELKAAHYEVIRKLGRLDEIQHRLRREADAHEKNGQLQQAVEVLTELADVSPTHVAVHRDVARLLETINKPGEAREWHLKVIKLLLDRAELEEARETAETLVSRHPEDAQCCEDVADLLAKSAYADLAARYYSSAADVALANKDVEHVIELLKKAVNARPSWTDVRERLAMTLEAAEMDEEAFQVRIGMADSMIELGDPVKASEVLGNLSRMRPESPEIRMQLVKLHERTGNREEQAVVLRELAELYHSTGEASAALEAYRKLAAIAPDDPDVLNRYVEILSQAKVPAEELPEEYARLADALARRGDYTAALQTYEQALGLAPENTGARSRYATFLLSRGNRGKALAEMRKLAHIYMERNESTAAAEVLNAALTISPRDADLCLELATAQEAAGMHEDARVSYARASAILASTAAVKGIDTYRRILTQDEGNTAVRLRLVELLFNSGDKMEAAREGKILAEMHINRGELEEAEKVYRIIDDCQEESLEEVQESIRRDSYDPSLQYVHYVRLGNRLFHCGDIDGALDAYRTARSLHDDQPELIQKCIDCVSLIAPEAEAISDYLVMAEKMLLAGNFAKARQVYEKVRLIDPFNNDAKCGLETVNAAERKNSSAKGTADDDLVLKNSRAVHKRVALMDLLVACREAADNHVNESQQLGRK